MSFCTIRTAKEKHSVFVIDNPCWCLPTEALIPRRGTLTVSESARAAGGLKQIAASRWTETTIAVAQRASNTKRAVG